MAVVGAVAAVIGVGISYESARKSASIQETQARVEASQQASDRADRRRKAIRLQRIKSANIEQSAKNTGVASSSGEIASVGGLASDFAITQGVLSEQADTSLKTLNNTRDLGQAKVMGQAGSVLSSVGYSVLGANLEGDPGIDTPDETPGVGRVS